MADEVVESGRRVLKGGPSGVVSHSGNDLVIKNAELAHLIDAKFGEMAKIKGPHKEAIDVDVTIRW